VQVNRHDRHFSTHSLLTHPYCYYVRSPLDDPRTNPRSHQDTSVNLLLFPHLRGSEEGVVPTQLDLRPRLADRNIEWRVLDQFSFLAVRHAVEIPMYQQRITHIIPRGSTHFLSKIDRPDTTLTIPKSTTLSKGTPRGLTPTPMLVSPAPRGHTHLLPLLELLQHGPLTADAAQAGISSLDN